MADDIAIKVEHISKDFVLPHEKVTSVKSAFTHMFNRNRTTEVQHALEDVSFEIKKGEFFGIVGRNGSGKSTMLKILAGIYQPTNGKVSVDGKLVPFIELGVGFNPELTGRENVYLNGAMFGFSRQEIANLYDDIVRFAELERFMDQKLKNYSSGMQVRLAFSMATRSNADILLVDEVLAVGDADFQRKCFEYFKMLKRDKKTVIFVSHDMGAVREYCDRAVLVKDGKLAATGTAEHIAQAYLKLFNDNAAAQDEEVIGEDGNRWGNGWANLQDVRVELKKDNILISYDVVANRDVTELICGFRIRSSDGRELLGTNATILRKPPLNLKDKQRVTVTWEVLNVLSEGSYFIDPSLILRDGATVCDWWDEAKKLTVKHDQTTPYPITPPVDMTIK